MYLYTYKYLPPPRLLGPEGGPVSVHPPRGGPKWIGGLGGLCPCLHPNLCSVSFSLSSIIEHNLSSLAL